MKKTIPNILIGAAVLLVIPLLGNIFIPGFNWGLGDFVFAWVFWVILALTFTFVTRKIHNRVYKIAAGTFVILFFTAIWVMLATG